MRGLLFYSLLTTLLLGVALGGVAYGQNSPDADALLEAARRHVANDEPDEAMAAYRRFLLAEPGHREAYVELLRLANEHGAKSSPELLGSLGEKFPSGTHLRQTEHFLIVYDMPHAWADTRAKMLEQVHDAFYRQMVEAGFQPWPLRERLVCVLFADHEDYLVYAKEIDAGPIKGSGGFYTTRLNRVVFFSNRSSPQLREHGKRIEQLRRQVNTLQQQQAAAQSRGDASRAQNLSNQRIRALRALSQIENQYNSAVGRGNIAQTFHEAAHLLAFNTGIQMRTRRYPVWVSEGLATAFETVNPAKRFGPRHGNPHRQQALREALAGGELMPLEQFVTLRDMRGVPQSRRMTAYAQAWGLFHFLWNHRLDELRDYMQGLANGRYSAGHAETAREGFEAAFGDIDELDRAWRQWVRGLE